MSAKTWWSNNTKSKIILDSDEWMWMNLCGNIDDSSADSRRRSRRSRNWNETPEYDALQKQKGKENHLHSNRIRCGKYSTFVSSVCSSAESINIRALCYWKLLVINDFYFSFKYLFFPLFKSFTSSRPKITQRRK